MKGYSSIKISFNPVKALNFAFASCGALLLLGMVVFPFFYPFLSEYRTQDLKLISKYRDSRGYHHLIMEEEISGLNYKDYNVSVSKYDKAEIGDGFTIESSLLDMNPMLETLMFFDTAILVALVIFAVGYGISYVYTEGDKDFTIDIERIRPISIQRLIGKDKK